MILPRPRLSDIASNHLTPRISHQVAADYLVPVRRVALVQGPPDEPRGTGDEHAHRCESTPPPDWNPRPTRSLTHGKGGVSWAELETAAGRPLRERARCPPRRSPCRRGRTGAQMVPR